MSMPSYKTHSIKNNKKLSFIIEGESEEQVKNTLSAEGFIVITLEPLEEGLNQENSFFFVALQDNKNRTEGTIHTSDIFQAYKILREDYKYKVLKLYPSKLTDKKEQDFIFQNVLDVSLGAGKNKQEIEEENIIKNTISSSEVILLKKYLNTLVPLITDSSLTEKEKILYDIKKVILTSSTSSMEDIIKKTTKSLYDQADMNTKKKIYKIILPLVKQTHAFILPPWYYIIIENTTKISNIFKILFLPEKIGEIKKQQEKIKKSISLAALQKSSSPEKNIFTNNNIKILLKKKYRSSWLDIFKKEGGHSYFYSLMRQVKILFWLKKIQEYIGNIAMCTGFFLVLGFLVITVLTSTQFLFFNQFLIPLVGLIFVSLVFSVKEI